MLCVHSTTSFEYFVTDFQGQSKRPLTMIHEFATDLAWTGDDKYLILARELDPGPELNELRVSDGAMRKLSLSLGGNWPAISRDGRKLAFSASMGHVNIWRRDLLHPEAAPVQTYTSTLDQNGAQYSPDGKHVAFDSARSGLWSVWMADTDGSNLVQISHEGPAGFPRWSPDSQRVAFQMKDRNGGHAAILAASQDIIEPIESADGRFLYFPSRNANALTMMLSLDRADAAPQPVAGIPNISFEHQWAVVPSGIYFVPQAAPRTICFYDFATRHTREIFKTDRELSDGISVSPDGRYMLYSQLDENNSNIMLVSNFH